MSYASFITKFPVLIFLAFTLMFSKVITIPKDAVHYLSHEMGCDTDDSVSILTYNVWGLPISLYGHDQSSRFDRLPKAVLNYDTEIICLQEVFHKKLQERLLNTNTSYYLGSDYSCESKKVLGLIKKDCYGGLMTFSKYPIIYEEFYEFDTKKYSLIEKVGLKGFLLTNIIREGKSILIINTHLYAGDSEHASSIRLQQVKYILEKTKGLQNFETVIMAGDLNFNCTQDAQAYELLISELDLIDTGACDRESYTTANHSISKYKKKEEAAARLDFILAKTQSSELNIVNRSVVYKNEDQLSDHFGWQVSLQLDYP